MSRFRGARILTGSALLLVVLLAASLPQPAAADVTLTVSPVRVDRVARPGESFDVRLVLRNSGTSVGSVVARATDVSISDSTGSVTVGTPTQLSLAPWVRIQPDRFTLGPGQQQDVAVRVAVPDNAVAGIRLGAISFVTGEPIPGRVTFAGEVSSVLSLRVRGVFDPSNPAAADPARLRLPGGATVDIGLRAPAVALGWPVTIQAVTRNTGGDLVDGRASLTVYGPLGAPEQEIQFGDVQILPGGARELDANADGTFYAMGPYTFVPQVREQGSGALAQGEPQVVWLVPVVPLVAALGIVVLIGVVFVAGRATRPGTAGGPASGGTPVAPRPAARSRRRPGELPPGATAGPAIDLVNPPSIAQDPPEVTDDDRGEPGARP